MPNTPRLGKSCSEIEESAAFRIGQQLRRVLPQGLGMMGTELILPHSVFRHELQAAALGF